MKSSRLPTLAIQLDDIVITFEEKHQGFDVEKRLSVGYKLEGF